MRDIKMPPLPEPNLMDVGSTPRDIKGFLTGYATAYARAAVQANVPDGWVMVPVEPTQEMAEAYLKANSEYWERTDSLPTPPDRWRTGTPVDATKAGYRAMLSAIPKG